MLDAWDHHGCIMAVSGWRSDCVGCCASDCCSPMQCDQVVHVSGAIALSRFLPCVLYNALCARSSCLEVNCVYSRARVVARKYFLRLASPIMRRDQNSSGRVASCLVLFSLSLSLALEFIIPQSFIAQSLMPLYRPSARVD